MSLFRLLYLEISIVQHLEISRSSRRNKLNTYKDVNPEISCLLPLAGDKIIVKTRQTLDLIASGPGLVVWTCFCVHNSQTKYRLILSTQFYDSKHIKLNLNCNLKRIRNVQYYKVSDLLCIALQAELNDWAPTRLVCCTVQLQ